MPASPSPRSPRSSGSVPAAQRPAGARGRSPARSPGGRPSGSSKGPLLAVLVIVGLALGLGSWLLLGRKPAPAPDPTASGQAGDAGTVAVSAPADAVPIAAATVPPATAAVLAPRTAQAPVPAPAKTPASPAASRIPGGMDLVSAGFLGGPGDDEIRACAIQADGGIVLAGSWGGGQAPGIAATRIDGEAGFIARLGEDGRAWKSLTLLAAPVEAIALDREDRILALSIGPAGEQQVQVFDPTAAKVLRSFAAGGSKSKGEPAMALDGNGDVLVLAGSSIQRFAADGSRIWSQPLPAHGDSRPRDLAVEPRSGIAVAVGYGMTRTRKEPYKDPYAHAFDRAGKPIWTLWNPDPKTVGSDTPLHLESDGTGNRASATPDGRFLLGIYHDGGNAISARDPRDPAKPIDAKVFGNRKAGIAETFQAGPGWGMKGAITTSVLFRVDPASGDLERGTWMCAWLLNHTRANSLTIKAMAGDEGGCTVVAGDSASDCPVKDPWFAWRANEYKGGGFVALFDGDFQLIRCGTFSSSSLGCTATRGGLVVAAGRASDRKKDKSGAVQVVDADNLPRSFQALQGALAGGSDGYVVTFRRK